MENICAIYRVFTDFLFCWIHLIESIGHATNNLFFLVKETISLSKHIFLYLKELDCDGNNKELACENMLLNYINYG